MSSAAPPIFKTGSLRLRGHILRRRPVRSQPIPEPPAPAVDRTARRDIISLHADSPAGVIKHNSAEDFGCQGKPTGRHDEDALLGQATFAG